MALQKCPMRNLRPPLGQRVAVPTDPDRKGQTPVSLAPLPPEVQEALTLPRPPIPPHPHHRLQAHPPHPREEAEGAGGGVGHHPNTKGLPPPGGQGRGKPQGQEGKALPAFTSPEATDPGHPKLTVDQVKRHQMQAPLAKKESGGRGKAPRCSRETRSRTTRSLVFSWPGAGLFPLPAWPGGWARGSYAGSGGLGLAVLGPGLAMALEEQEARGFEGIPQAQLVEAATALGPSKRTARGKPGSGCRRRPACDWSGTGSRSWPTPLWTGLG